MPPVSQAQRKAMFAAKAGKSTLGIPQSVGADFVKVDPGGKLPQKLAGGGQVAQDPRGEEHTVGDNIDPAQFMSEEDIAKYGSGKYLAKGGPVKSRRNYAKGGPIF